MKYFKHSTTLRFEPSCRDMIDKYGLEGYGLYCLLLETAAESVEVKNVTPVTSESVEQLSKYFRNKNLAEMIQYAIDEKILKPAGDKIIFEKVLTLLDEYLSKSSTMRESLEEYRNKEEKHEIKTANDADIDEDLTLLKRLLI